MPQTKRQSLQVKTKLLGILLLIPAALFISFTVIIPVVWNLVLSFADWSPLTKMKMVGFDHYIELFRDQVTINGFKYSIFIALVSSAIALSLGMLLALLVYRMGNREGTVLRLIFFAPSMMPFIIIGLMFTFMLDPATGLVNHILGVIGLDNLQHAWLSEPGLVLWVVAAVSGWKGSGAVMMLFYTAIVSVPTSMFEAARLEGAGYFRQIGLIILPLIMPTIRLVSMLVLIGSFKTYDVVMAMTKGGPGDHSKTVPMQMLDVSFKFNEFGYSAAIGVVFTILVGVVIFLSMKMARGDVYEY